MLPYESHLQVCSHSLILFYHLDEVGHPFLLNYLVQHSLPVGKEILLKCFKDINIVCLFVYFNIHIYQVVVSFLFLHLSQIQDVDFPHDVTLL